MKYLLDTKFWIEQLSKKPFAVICGFLISSNIYTAKGWMIANEQIIVEVQKCAREKEAKDAIRLADFQLLLQKSEDLKKIKLKKK